MGKKHPRDEPSEPKVVKKLKRALDVVPVDTPISSLSQIVTNPVSITRLSIPVEVSPVESPKGARKSKRGTIPKKREKKLEAKEAARLKKLEKEIEYEDLHFAHAHTNSSFAKPNVLTRLADSHVNMPYYRIFGSFISGAPIKALTTGKEKPREYLEGWLKRRKETGKATLARWVAYAMRVLKGTHALKNAPVGLEELTMAKLAAELAMVLGSSELLRAKQHTDKCMEHIMLALYLIKAKVSVNFFSPDLGFIGAPEGGSELLADSKQLDKAIDRQKERLKRYYESKAYQEQKPRPSYASFEEWYAKKRERWVANVRKVQLPTTDMDIEEEGEEEKKEKPKLSWPERLERAATAPTSKLDLRLSFGKDKQTIDKSYVHKHSYMSNIFQQKQEASGEGSTSGSTGLKFRYDFNVLAKEEGKAALPYTKVLGTEKKQDQFKDRNAKISRIVLKVLSGKQEVKPASRTSALSLLDTELEPIAQDALELASILGISEVLRGYEHIEETIEHIMLTFYLMKHGQADIYNHELGFVGVGKGGADYLRDRELIVDTIARQKEVIQKKVFPKVPGEKKKLGFEDWYARKREQWLAAWTVAVPSDPGEEEDVLEGGEDGWHFVGYHGTSAAHRASLSKGLKKTMSSWDGQSGGELGHGFYVTQDYPTACLYGTQSAALASAAEDVDIWRLWSDQPLNELQGVGLLNDKQWERFPREYYASWDYHWNAYEYPVYQFKFNERAYGHLRLELHKTLTLRAAEKASEPPKKPVGKARPEEARLPGKKIQVVGDGDCFFHAVAFYVKRSEEERAPYLQGNVTYGSQEEELNSATEVRREVAEWLAQSLYGMSLAQLKYQFNPAPVIGAGTSALNWWNHLTNNGTDIHRFGGSMVTTVKNLVWNHQTANLLQPLIWGDLGFMWRAIVAIYDRPIHLYQGTARPQVFSSDGVDGEPIILYHSGNHYDVIAANA
jgi:hypothetical protein